MSAATSTATSARLGVMLTELRLPTMKRLVPEVCVQSDREGWPGHQLVETLLEYEMHERDVRRIERHRAESALSPDKRLSSFDFAAVPCVSKAQVMALAQGHEWLQRARGLEHKQECAWALAAESNASIESGTARKDVSSNGAARTGTGQGSMRSTVMQGTAGYVTRMSGGVGGRGREASSYPD